MPLHKVANTLFYSKGDIMIRLCNSETVNGCISNWKQSRDGKNMLKSYFILFQKNAILGVVSKKGWGMS